MFDFFWPEYSCNTTSQLIVTEEDFKDTSSVTYLPDYTEESQPEPAPAC